ncbi:MAG: hypothetical protein U0074_12335 [Kouleothrix sp.]
MCWKTLAYAAKGAGDHIVSFSRRNRGDEQFVFCWREARVDEVES